jgi:hypothetical protein
MTATTLTQAIHLSLIDFAVGFVAAVTLSLLLWLIASAQKHGPKRVRPERAEPVDFDGEIRVHDRTRRGPEALAGPESRDRLLMTGRRPS